MKFDSKKDNLAQQHNIPKQKNQNLGDKQ